MMAALTTLENLQQGNNVSLGVLENQIHLIVHVRLPALVVAGDDENHRILWNERLSDVEEHFMGQIEELQLGSHLNR
jgi:hypothetical protein